jgi:hypothetical protein
MSKAFQEGQRPDYLLQKAAFRRRETLSESAKLSLQTTLVQFRKSDKPKNLKQILL